MKKVKVSIVVPCYNAASSLKMCLDSLMNQSLKDLEIICVNDGSKDDTLNILNQYSILDKRIIVIDKKNGGVSSARNAGLLRASGDFVICVDSDDFVRRNMLEEMYNFAMEKSADIVKCNRADVYDFGSLNQKIIDRKPLWDKTTIVLKDEFEKKLYVEFFNRSRLCNVFTMLVRNNLIKKNKIFFPEELKVDEDEIFVIKLLLAANSFVYIPKTLYFYIKNSTGLTGTGTNIYDRFDSRKKHIEILIRLSQEWHINDYNKLLHHKIGFVGLYTAMQISAKNENFTRKEQLKLFKKILQDELFREDVKKINNNILVFPEKILCFFVKFKFFYIGFYYSRIFESLLKKYRNKIERLRAKH